MDPSPVAEYGAASFLFEGLSEADLQEALAHTSVRQFLAGDVLIRQDVWCGQLFILRDGVVQVVVEKQQITGELEVPIARLSAGDVFGEVSLVTGAPPSATVRAITDGQALVLAQQDFLQLVIDLPEFSRRINTILGDRVRSSNMQMAERRPQQIVFAVGPEAPWHELAQAIARFACVPTLLVDLSGKTSSELTVSDVLAGRTAGPGSGPERTLTVLQGAGCDVSDIATLLRRLGDEYKHVLIALSGSEPTISTQLLAFADRVLVAGLVNRTAELRARVAQLSAPNGQRELGAVLTEAPATVTVSAATFATLSEIVGAPVLGILPAEPESARPGIEALGRRLIGQQVGVALGAGGAKGWAHIGAIRALRRAGVPIDFVAGVSIGAILGAALAMGRSDEWMEQTIGESITQIFRPVFPLHAILTNRPLGRWLRSHAYGDTQIEDTPIPLAISAADLNEGSEIILRHGPIWRAALASAAIPGIYPAVRIGDHYLVDGGVVNPVPVGTARLLGADIVVAVDLSVPLAPRHEIESERSGRLRPPFIMNNIVRSRDIMMSVIQARSVAEPSVLVKPAVEGIGLRNFREGSRFIAAGEEAMEKALPVLERHLPWLGAQA
jgi:NTE family protein